MIISGRPRIDPVVKEIELDACRRDGVLNDSLFQRGSQSGVAFGVCGQRGRDQRDKDGQCAEQAERADRIMMLHKITSPDVPMVRRNIDLDFTYILHLRGKKCKEICFF